ncbi:MAG: 50S ribosomal protein L12 [Candidatus Lokiarchaeota archaeon]|jgi:large subunit ribosomal protein L12
MESIYAALLLHKASKDITEANIEKILKAAGVDADKGQLSKIVAGLKETNIQDIISSAAAAPVMAAPVASSVSTGATPKEEKKEDKEEEEEEEEPTGIGSLF